jgi:hypothetical protein
MLLKDLSESRFSSFYEGKISSRCNISTYVTYPCSIKWFMITFSSSFEKKYLFASKIAAYLGISSI